MDEPGEDTCLRCHHPEHLDMECRVLLSTSYGDPSDGGRCDCVDVHALIRAARWPETDVTEPPPF